MDRNFSYYRKFGKKTLVTVPNNSKIFEAEISKDGGYFTLTAAKPKRLNKDFISLELNENEMSAQEIRLKIDYIPIYIATFGRNNCGI